MKKLIKFIASIMICISLSFISIKNNNVKAKSFNNIEIKCEKMLDESEEKLSVGAEVAIVLGAIVVSAGVGTIIYFFVFKKKKNKN